MSALAVPGAMQSVEHGGSTYLPVHISSLRLDSETLFDLYFQPGANQPFVLYCERNTAFSESHRQRLIDNRVDCVYILEDQREGYNKYLAQNLQDLLDDKNLSANEKSTLLYDSAQTVVSEILEEPESRENIRRGKEVVAYTVKFLTAEDFPLEQLLRTISADYYIYTHSVNVVAYSIALATRSGFTDQATLREIANGALLHDVGKSKIDPAIMDKPTALSTGEWEKMQSHVQIGHDILKAQDCVGEIALDIVLHHHERLNGGGYPDRLEGDQISPFVRIVGIADVFDALTTDRHHQKGKSTFEALQVMQQTMKNELDPALFRTFVGMMGGKG